MPWPLRWALAAIVLGFCAAIALWAFEFGKGIAGLETGAKEELVKLREEVSHLRDERDRAQSVVNTAGSLLTTEKAAQERLVAQLKRLEAENRELRDNLGFFEKLLPTGATEGIAIRGLAGRGAGQRPDQMAGPGDSAGKERGRSSAEGSNSLLKACKTESLGR